MEVVDLKYLSIAAKTGNLSRAAESLGLHASTISRRIARLEDEIGVTLFERGHFGIRLTGAGRAVMVHVRRALDDLDTVMRAGQCNGSGAAGQIRLGVRMPPIGEPLQSLLAAWHERYPDVVLTLYEMNDHEICAALAERRLDAALVTKHTLWPGATAASIYREQLVAALPDRHVLRSCDSLSWALLRGETFLTQGWDDSHTAREFYASLLGSGVKFCTHAASKQSVLALVGAGFGITLATRSQSEVAFPHVVFKPIVEPDVWLEVELVWLPRSEEAVVGRFLAFMRDEACSRRLL